MGKVSKRQRQPLSLTTDKKIYFVFQSDKISDNCDERRKIDVRFTRWYKKNKSKHI